MAMATKVQKEVLNCLYEEITLMQMNCTDEIWRAAGKLGDLWNKGFLMARASTYVWGPNTEAKEMDLVLEIRDNGIGMLIKWKKNTAGRGK